MAPLDSTRVPGALRLAAVAALAAAACGESPRSPFEGTIRTHQIASPVPGIVSRTVRVVEPPGYGDPASADVRYPVLYMQDGQNCLDQDPYGHGGWQIHRVSYDLVARGLAAPALLVLVHGSAYRTEEYVPGAGTAPGPTAEGYLDYLETAVVPFIDAQYRTRPTAADRGLGGSSFGALLALHGAWTRPEVFGFAMGMSSSFWAYDFPEVVRQTPPPKKALRIYIDSGSGNTEWDDGRAGTALLHQYLVDLGFVDGVDLEYVYEEGGTHDEASWRRRLPMALPFLFPP